MSMVDTSIIKQPFKLIEIPLNKFHDEAVPHHQAVLETHKSTVRKLIIAKNIEPLKREINDKKRVVRQLKDLMYELDTLRTQVEDSDLARFDSNTLSLRKIILGLISSYNNLETKATRLIESQVPETDSDKNDNPLHGASQIQMQGDLTDLKVKEEEQKLRQVEALNQDIEDVHGIFVDLNQMVVEQKDHVDIVEVNTEVAAENVKGGLRQLIKASKWKKASYPVAGACIGTIIGGPIGSVAGLKIGGLAAIGCGLIGYISGRFIKKANDEEILQTESQLNEIEDNAPASTAVSEKKDI